MDWNSALNDLANSWKVGLAFIVLVALRLLLTSKVAGLVNLRNATLGRLAFLGGGSSRKRNVAQDGDGTGEGEVTEQRTPAEELRASILEFVDSGLIALVLVFMIIRPFVVQAFYIPSGSMRNTLIENDKILVSKFVYRFREPRRGDVVVFKAPPQAASDEKDFIKRLIALPGETVEVRAGQVLINGEPLDEPYIAEPPIYEMPPVVIEPGKVFVMGDNRNDSNDSHIWGWRSSEQLDEKRIRGKAEVIFWPIPRIGLVR